MIAIATSAQQYNVQREEVEQFLRQLLGLTQNEIAWDVKGQAMARAVVKFGDLAFNFFGKTDRESTLLLIQGHRAAAHQIALQLQRFLNDPPAAGSIDCC